MMREILKPYFNEYVLTNNVLQEAHDTAKGDLFGDPDDNVQYAYAIAKEIQQMGHTVKIIFTNQRTTMKTANVIVLKEEMDRKKATKLRMSRQEKLIMSIIGRRIMTPSYVRPLDLKTILNSSF
jgi:hypothetical protein